MICALTDCSLEISTTSPSTKSFSYLHTLLEMMQIEPGNRQASFSVSHMSLWKSIARVVGYPAWECLYPLIISFPDIAGESVPEEPSRICCLCEIVSGFSRGSRDWSYAQQQIWVCIVLTPYFRPRCEFFVHILFLHIIFWVVNAVLFCTFGFGDLSIAVMNCR